jgi:methionyl-tRNA formyltransferase
MGTPEFAIPSLDILIKSGYHVGAVVTAPDRPRGRGQEVTPTPVKLAALMHGISVLQPEDLRDADFLSHLISLQVDLIVVVAFRILPREVFTIPRLGSFNLHASLLPRYRGAAPINWAIINGETETGVTTFFLEEKVDAGGIILQASLPILPEDDAGTIHDRLARLGAGTVLESVRLIELGKVIPVAQDHALASPAPKIFKDDCRIRWELPSGRVRNFVRGLSPLPSAWTMYQGKVVKMFRVSVAPPGIPGRPGEIHLAGDLLLVGTGDSPVAIEELQLEGGKRMRTDEFLRGHHPQSGELFI